MDLSWPRGASVNDSVSDNTYVGLDFILTLPNIDQVVNAIKKFGKGSYMAKIDISRAFKHVPIDPADTKLLGLYWKGSYYLEKHLCFGFKQGSQLFQHISDSVRYIMAQNGFFVLSYIDDYMMYGNEANCKRAFERLTILLQELGFTIKVKKNVLPTTKMICLGILMDSNSLTMSIPPEKLGQIKNLIKNWDFKTSCTKNQLQSLLGSLLYISKCVKYSKFFLNRLLQTLRDHSKEKIIKS